MSIKIMEKSDNSKDLKKIKRQHTAVDDSHPYSNQLPFTSTSIDKDEWNRIAFKPWTMNKNDPILKYKTKIHQNCDNPKKNAFIIRKITDPSEVKIVRRYEEGRNPIFQRSDILSNYYQISDDRITSTSPIPPSTSPQKLKLRNSKSTSPKRSKRDERTAAKVKKRLRSPSSPSVHGTKITKRVTRQRARRSFEDSDRNSSDSSSTSDNDNRRYSDSSNSDSSSPRYRYRRRGDKFEKRKSSSSTSRLYSTPIRTTKHDSKVRGRPSSKVKSESVPYFTDKARESERLQRIQHRHTGRTVRSKSRSPSSRSTSLTQQQSQQGQSSTPLTQMSTASQTNEPQPVDEMPSRANILPPPLPPPPPDFFIRPYPPGMMGRGMRIGVMVPHQPQPPYHYIHPSHLNYSHMEYRPRMLPPQLVPRPPRPHLPNEIFFRPRFNKFSRRPRNVHT